MKPTDTLFAPALDWLEHTLQHAGQRLTEVSILLPDATRVTRLDTGILLLTPGHATDSEGLILSAGIHGNETAPIELLNELITEVLTGQLPLAAPALFILGNPPAMLQGSRFIDFNLNRLFNGAHQQAADPWHGTPEARRAAQLENTCRTFCTHVSKARHYDLHTAIRLSEREKFALYPFVPGRQLPALEQQLLLAMGISTLLLQHKSGTTFSSFTSLALSAESFTLELGQVQPFSANDLSRLIAAQSVLRSLLSGRPLPQSEGTAEVYEVVHEIIHTGAGFRFHVPDDVSNFTEYPPGTVIWEDEAQAYRVGPQAEAIIFPNPAVPVGQRVGLMVRRTLA
ncbi:MAG: succinylglutamate desuccinylase [Marinobacter sp.]|nr:succinylglutamate desuccinylase [Marinobacter sp.]